MEAALAYTYFLSPDTSSLEATPTLSDLEPSCQRLPNRSTDTPVPNQPLKLITTDVTGHLLLFLKANQHVGGLNVNAVIGRNCNLVSFNHWTTPPSI